MLRDGNGIRRSANAVIATTGIGPPASIEVGVEGSGEWILALLAVENWRNATTESPKERERGRGWQNIVDVRLTKAARSRIVKQCIALRIGRKETVIQLEDHNSPYIRIYLDVFVKQHGCLSEMIGEDPSRFDLGIETGCSNLRTRRKHSMRRQWAC